MSSLESAQKKTRGTNYRGADPRGYPLARRGAGAGGGPVLVVDGGGGFGPVVARAEGGSEHKLLLFFCF